MTNNLSTREQIENELNGEAAAWWNGLDREGVNEFIAIAQREGLAAAVAAVNECAAPDESAEGAAQ